MFMVLSVMSESKYGNNNVLPLEPNVVVREMIDSRRTPVYVEGRSDDDNGPFISAGVNRRIKKIATDCMLLSDGDDFFSDCSNNSGSKIPGKRTCVSLSTRPLIIVRCTSEGSFENPSKTLKWFNDSIFAKKIVGQISVPGRLASAILFRMVNLEGLGSVKI